MKRSRWRLGAILALTSVAVVAVLIGPVGSAVGFFSGGLSLDVQVQSPAILLSRGAALDVPVQVVCTSRQADLYVQVTQRAGSEIAQGFGYKLVTCEGDLQQVHVTVAADAGKAFKKGSAVAQAEIFGCLRFCGDETNTATIDLVKSK
jgi:hypothetical protein